MSIKPIACPCGATDFEWIWQDNRPYWKCPKGHKTFGYWQTEIAVRRALQHYREITHIRSSWGTATGGGYRSYAAWEAVIDTRIDLEREISVLDFQEQALIRERYLEGLTVSETAERHGVDERTVRRWISRITREIAFRLGETW